MRLKHGAFRHLRMAAKGSAFGIRRLLEKAGENFWIVPQAGSRTAPLPQNNPKGRLRPRAKPRPPFPKRGIHR